jgi:hypothetical protein
MTIPDKYHASEVLAEAILAHVNMPSYTRLSSVDFYYDYLDADAEDKTWAYTFVVTHQHGTYVPAEVRNENDERIRIIEKFLSVADYAADDLPLPPSL